MKAVGSFICFIGWASIALGQLVIGITILVIGFTLIRLST